MLLVSSALAAAPVCGTPLVLDALRGFSAPPHPNMLVPPSHLDGRPTLRAKGKSIYGRHYEHYVETTNFTIDWSDADIDSDVADAAGEALEGAWTAFLREQDWTPPVSSDTYKIWVVLDPDLGMTGYTTEYYTDDFPEGYPVIYLDPSWASQPAFFGALAAHEFMHTLQYALRDWDGTDASEAWYWEASANWASELADPDRDGYQYASEWYADQADLSYDSMTGYHQYGIFVFNAWLEQVQTGAGGMKAVWDLSAVDDSNWRTLLEESTGADATDLWGGFTGAYANGQLAESDLYTAVTTEGALQDGVSGDLPELGTHYYRVRADARVVADGDVVLADSDEHGDVVDVQTGDILGVTAVDASSYVLTVETDADTDADSDTDTDADSDTDTDTAGGAETGGEEEAGGCACDSGTARPWLGLLTWMLLRRPRQI